MNAELSALRQPSVGFAGWRFSYGWIVVAVLFITALVIQGAALGGITMFDDRVLGVLQVSRGVFKFRDFIYIISAASSCLLIGWIVERTGVRPIMITGLALLSTIYIVYSGVTSIYVVYLLHAALGFSFASTHVVIMVIVISRWFGEGDPRRGIALGIAAAGASTGAVVMSRLIATLLGHLDWRAVMQVLAVLPVLLMPLVWFLVRSPDHAGVDPWRLSARKAAPGLRFSFSGILSLPGLVLMLSIMPIFYVSASVSTHLVLLLRDQGLPIEVAAGGVGAMFMAGLIGKASSGFSLLRFRLSVAWAFFSLMAIAGSLLLAEFGAVAYTPALALIGLGWGGCFPLAQLRIAEVFPGPGLARVLGVFVMCESFGAASGAWVTGILFDKTGSYHLALMVNLALLIAGLVGFIYLTVSQRQAHHGQA